MDTLTWNDWRGKEQRRLVNDTIRLAESAGTPGHASLLMAANTHLSVSELRKLIASIGVQRSDKWIRSRRWLYQQPGTVNPGGHRPNCDGKDAQAVAIMRAHTTLSLRNMVRLLAQHGIRRGRTWVMMHRCD